MKLSRRAVALSAAVMSLLVSFSPSLLSQAAPQEQAPPLPPQAADDPQFVITINGQPIEQLRRQQQQPAPPPTITVTTAPPPPATAVPAPAPQAVAKPGAALAKQALRYRGVPYRWAGMTSRGMDCSGLVARVLMERGIRAPHNSAALYKLGKKVAFKQLQAGDLLFFNTSGRGISHVGIYLGDNKFVHASSVNGSVVVTSIYEPYYKRRLVGARRL